jgi:hypothetical protein
MGDEDMPEDDGALVAGAVGAGGGFILVGFGVADGGRTAVVVAIVKSSSESTRLLLRFFLLPLYLYLLREPSPPKRITTDAEPSLARNETSRI